MDLKKSYFTVASNSMYPILKSGDKITIQCVSSQDIFPGMVIVFKADRDRKIVHRVVKKENFVLVTAGDNLRKYDNPIHISDVLGAVKDLEVKRPLFKFARIIRAVKRHFL